MEQIDRRNNPIIKITRVTLQTRILYLSLRFAFEFFFEPKDFFLSFSEALKMSINILQDPNLFSFDIFETFSWFGFYRTLCFWFFLCFHHVSICFLLLMKVDICRYIFVRSSLTSKSLSSSYVGASSTDHQCSLAEWWYSKANMSAKLLGKWVNICVIIIANKLARFSPKLICLYSELRNRWASNKTIKIL